MISQREIVYVIQPIEHDNYKILHEEAISLIESADAEYAGSIFQPIRDVNPATYIGEGKLAELNERLCDLDVTVLFNGELSPSQTLNISQALGGKKVIDRTTLILDIFALRAQTSEGKLQVELAQLKYLYPRLKGKGSALSRLGGGIGTRGPGETKLETDRRHIRSRIHTLEERLEATKQRRSLLSERRKKDKTRVIALVGYTNTGKSALLNTITGADVMTKNALFATLDPTSRTFEIDGFPFLMVDTVGFLQNLPHHLIDAFRSTLESALNCDLALIVCDATGEYDLQLKITLETLREIGCSVPYLVVMNKCDAVSRIEDLPHDCVCISAKENQGIDQLKRRIFERLQDEFIVCKLFVPYLQFSRFGSIRNLITENDVQYIDDGMQLNAIIPKIHIKKFEDYIRH